jgi:hypothetical protein
MADAPFDDFAPAPRRREHRVLNRAPTGRYGTTRLGRLMNGLGAALSAALVVGLGVWAWQLAVRDISGVPVIRALEGPARTAAADPGGDLARHQGLAVNAVTAEGEASAPADTLVLAPKPVDLSEDDLPMAPLADAAEAEVLPMPEADPVMAAAGAAEADLPQGAVALGGTLPADVIPADIPGVARSPVPRLRPGTPLAMTAPAIPEPADAIADPLAEAAAAAVAAALAPQESEADPATLAPGTELVQLGTYETPEAARADWERIASVFSPLLDDKRRVIETAESGGATFYRLRAEGFEDKADARRFCSVLEEAQALCVPATVR